MRAAIFIFLLVLTSCSGGVTSINLKNMQGKEYSLQQIKENKATVVFFLAPDCPLCQSYTLNINNMVTDYGKNRVEFIGVVAGEYYTNEEIKAYMDEYKLAIPILLDPKMKLTNQLGAKITPEVFVLSAKGDVLYSGKIDNWYHTLGRNRQKPTEFYLQDALDAINQNKPIAIKKTKAIGCYIE